MRRALCYLLVRPKGGAAVKRDDRRQRIIDMLVEEGNVSLDEFARRFDVSKMTIHRDLDDLETEGLLRKLRGGATIESSAQFESDYRYRTRKAAAEKRLIAQKAADLVEPGMSVMLDDSSTSQAIVPFLIEKRPLTVITNNLSVMNAMAGQAGITMITLGGTYSRKFNGFFGLLTEQALSDLRADLVLISSSSISGTTVFHQDQEVIEVKRGMIEAGARRYLMVDHEKFGRTALHRVVELDRFDGVVTSDAVPSEALEKVVALGIELHLAKGDKT